jgi:hypothetical protein
MSGNSISAVQRTRVPHSFSRINPNSTTRVGNNKPWISNVKKQNLAINNSDLPRTLSANMKNASINDEASFVFKSFEIPGGNKRAVDYSRLLRKPIHKPVKEKFDKTSLTQEKTVNILTKEDNFNLFDMPWISNLRNMDNSELARLKNMTGKDQTVPSPPSFYDEDLKKFSSRSPQRKDHLNRIVDFDVNGNPNELWHLIKHNTKGSPTNSGISFGFGLRKYNSVANLQNADPWKFPGLKGAKEAIACPPAYSNILNSTGLNTARGPVKIKGKMFKRDDKYNDKFPQNNTNSIRHMFSQTSQIGSIKWGSSLRWNSDKQK